MRSTKLFTWLDIQRVIREKTAGNRDFPPGIVRIGCYSDALEIGIVRPEDRVNAKIFLKECFGDWYMEEKSVIQLDFGNAELPVEFMPGEERNKLDFSVRPFWEEIAYIREEIVGEAPDRRTLALPQPFPDEKPGLVSFYSFKGGVGRTLHLASFLFALLDRAKEIDKAITVLVIDADIEAPGLTYWDSDTKQQPAVSFLEFLEVYQFSPIKIDEVLKLFAREIKKSPRTTGKTIWYFLPACLGDTQLLDTPILPEHLARSSEGAWECGNAIYRLGKALDADYVLIDLRAGLSEISSPLIFDPRLQKYIVSTISEQSISGTSLVLNQVSRLAPSETEISDDQTDYYDPSLILSMLKPEFRQLENFENSLVRLRSAYIESTEDNVYGKRLQILETDFNEELLNINDWEEARIRLIPTSIMRIAREWAKNQLIPDRSSEFDISNQLDPLAEVEKLRNICKQYEYAENGKGKGLLITEPLKNLGRRFQDELPRVVSIGAKGAGKTFNYLQISQFGIWEKFIEHVIKKNVHSQQETNIFPLLQSDGLKDEARKITQDARKRLYNYLEDDVPEFIPSECQDRIRQMLNSKKATDIEWSIFWVMEMAKAFGMFPQSNDKIQIGELNNWIKNKGLKVVFLIDGLEDIFSNISSDTTQQTALKALIDLPKRLSEIRNSHIGLIVFVRRDFIRYTLVQNVAQFENLYRAYDLSWDEESFKKLVFWICSQADVIGAKEDELETLSKHELTKCLELLWGKKLGSDNSKEAYTHNWVFAALTDFKGRLQARDIVRFLLHAAEITYEKQTEVLFEKWSTNRILPPQAIRRALQPCSQKKVQEAMEEYPEFKKWVSMINESYKSADRKIPFTPDQFAMNQTTVRILEEMGVIYEERGKDGASCYYMPEIFRAGLDFTLDKGARPRVLVLKRKALGTST